MVDEWTLVIECVHKCINNSRAWGGSFCVNQVHLSSLCVLIIPLLTAKTLSTQSVAPIPILQQQTPLKPPYSVKLGHYFFVIITVLEPDGMIIEMHEAASTSAASKLNSVMKLPSFLSFFFSFLLCTWLLLYLFIHTCTRNAFFLCTHYIYTHANSLDDDNDDSFFVCRATMAPVLITSAIHASKTTKVNIFT